MKKYNSYSRLIKQEETRNMKKTVMYGLLSVVLVIALFMFGVPLITKLALFIADSKPSTQTNDNNLPVMSPKLYPLPEATNSANLSLTGYAIEASNVEIYVNETPAISVPVTDDNFTAKNILLEDGENTIYAVAKDASNNVSNPSPKVLITLDTLPPQISISEPADNTVLSGVKGKTVKIAGTTEAGCSLTINDRTSFINDDGTFQLIYPLNAGENKIKAVSTDKAGNSAEKEITVTYNP